MQSSVIYTYTNPVRTSQETHISATDPNRLMLFRETVAVYCENHTEHTDILCGQSEESLNGKTGGIHNNHSVVSGLSTLNLLLVT
jgi:hypothetical protein